MGIVCYGLAQICNRRVVLVRCLVVESPRDGKIVDVVKSVDRPTDLGVDDVDHGFGEGRSRSKIRVVIFALIPLGEWIVGDLIEFVYRSYLTLIAPALTNE